MTKLLLVFVLACPAFAATCPTLVAGSRQCDITPPTDPWGQSSGLRTFRVGIPTGYVADGTASLIIANGAAGAVNPGAPFEGTTGWTLKCATVTPKCAVIYLDSLTSSRYHIESIVCASGTCTVKEKELSSNNSGNFSLTSLLGACAGLSNTNVSGTQVDNHTVTFSSGTTCTETNPNQYAAISGQNHAFTNLMRSEPSDSTDDIGYLVAVLKEQIPILNVDQKRIFCTGMSSGAFACASMSSSRPDIFAAIALVEGSIGTQHYNVNRSAGVYGANTDLETNYPIGTSPMNVLIFSGAADSSVPDCNGGVRPNFYQQSTMRETLQYYVALDHITSPPAYPCTVGTVVAPVSAQCNAAHTIAASYTVTASTTIARAAGDFAADGISTNHYVALRGFADATNNGAVCKVSAVSTLSLTVTGCTLASEGPTSATLDDNETIVFTLPASPVTAYGFNTTPPNNGIRWFNMGSTNYQQADCSISGSVSGATVTTPVGGLGSCWSTSAQLSCVPGSIAVGSGTVQPRPYLPTANLGMSWLATGGDDGTEIQAYSLNFGGHSYYGGFSVPGATLTLTASGGTLDRSSGSFATDSFSTGDIIGLNSAGGWVTNAGTNCTATVTSATRLTLASCSAALVDEVVGITGYVTDNVINIKNANVPAASNETDVAWTFFAAHPKPSTFNATSMKMANGKL